MSEETKEQQVSAETQEASAQGAETQSTDHRSEPREQRRGSRDRGTAARVTCGNGFTVNRVGLGIHLVRGTGGEFDHRTTVRRECAGIRRLIGH